MDRRVQEALDGERERSELTQAERRRLEEYEEAIARAVAPLAREEDIDVTSAVMSRIRSGAFEGGALREPSQTDRRRSDGVSDRLRSAWKWLWRPREVRVRPAWGLAAAAALVLAVVGPPVPGWEVDGAGGPPAAGSLPAPGPDEAAPGTVLVQFRLDAPDAGSVRLAGDFTGWQPAHAMNEVAPGVWSVMIPLEPGIHDYAFVVDGEHWRPDPLAPSVDDGFGGTNSRLALLPPERAPATRGTS